MSIQILLSTVIVLEAALLSLLLTAHATPYVNSVNAPNHPSARAIQERRQLQQAPQPITITSGPAENETVSRNDFPVMFQVPGNANTECLLSRGPITVRDWFQCTSPLMLPEVLRKEGRYTLRIRLVAEPTMAAQSEAVVSFYMDLTEPDTEILSSDYDPTDSTTYWFEFDGIGDDVDFFECELDYSGNWERCESPKIYRELVYGVHNFAVRAVDLAGNPDSTPAEEIFEIESPFLPVVDESPPSEVSSSPPEVSSLAAAPPSVVAEIPLPSHQGSLPSPSFVDLTKKNPAPSHSPLPPSPVPKSVPSDKENESDAPASLVAEASPEVLVDREDSAPQEDSSLNFGSDGSSGQKENQIQGTVVVKKFTPDTMSAVIMGLVIGLIAAASMGIVILYCSRGSRLSLRGGYSLI